MKCENVTGKQSKIRVFFGHFQRFSAHGWGGGGGAVVELCVFKLAKSDSEKVF